MQCDCCEQEMETPFWSNLVRSFCSLECTNDYLESEGYLPISGPGESARVNPIYLKGA